MTPKPQGPSLGGRTRSDRMTPEARRAAAQRAAAYRWGTLPRPLTVPCVARIKAQEHPSELGLHWVAWCGTGAPTRAEFVSNWPNQVEAWGETLADAEQGLRKRLVAYWGESILCRLVLLQPDAVERGLSQDSLGEGLEVE